MEKEGYRVVRRIVSILAVIALLMGCAPGRAEEWTQKQLLSYYEGSVFVGDSITGQLKNYVTEKRYDDPDYMQNTRFLSTTSYFLYTASRKLLLEDANNLVLAGKERPLYEIIEILQPRRVIILLGVNDLVGEKIEKGVGWCERIIDLAAEASPDTQVVFESLTPVTPDFRHQAGYQALWDEYNAALEDMCLRRGAGYIDVATPLKGEDGYLRPDYCRDGEYHLSDAGLEVWLDALADYARQQYDLGLWMPETAQ